MAKKITALNINEAIDNLEKEADKTYTPDKLEVIEKSGDYAVDQFQKRFKSRLKTRMAKLRIYGFNGFDIAGAFRDGSEWQLKRIANKMYNVGYSYDSIAEALGMDCADVVDMLDFD